LAHRILGELKKVTELHPSQIALLSLLTSTNQSMQSGSENAPNLLKVLDAKQLLVRFLSLFLSLSFLPRN
jgi:hypothetical protein